MVEKYGLRWLLHYTSTTALRECIGPVTGDLVRFNTDGTLNFVGRMDT